MEDASDDHLRSVVPKDDVQGGVVAEVGYSRSTVLSMQHGWLDIVQSTEANAIRRMQK